MRAHQFDERFALMLLYKKKRNKKSTYIRFSNEILSTSNNMVPALPPVFTKRRRSGCIRLDIWPCSGAVHHFPVFFRQLLRR